MGLNTNNGLKTFERKEFLSRKNYKQILFDKDIKPDGMFYLNKKPLILFYENPKNKLKLFKLFEY